MTNEVSRFTDTITAVFQQMYQWPVAVLLCVCLNIIGVWLKWLPKFPNRFIPPTLIVLGALINCLAGETGLVAPGQRNPQLILAMWGICIAFVAVLFHATVLKRLEPFWPVLGSKSKDEEPPAP